MHLVVLGTGWKRLLGLVFLIVSWMLGSDIHLWVVDCFWRHSAKLGTIEERINREGPSDDKALRDTSVGPGMGYIYATHRLGDIARATVLPKSG